MKTPKPRHKRKTTWAAIAAIALALPGILGKAAPLLSPDVAEKAQAGAAVAAAAAALFAREAAEPQQADSEGEGS